MRVGNALTWNLNIIYTLERSNYKSKCIDMNVHSLYQSILCQVLSFQRRLKVNDSKSHLKTSIMYNNIENMKYALSQICFIDKFYS